MGELALIEAIRATLSRRPGSRVVRWLGDDAAVVRAAPFAAVSVDVMVDGTHFRLDGGATPADAGHRALAGALSDLAGMGAEPGEAYLSRGRAARRWPRPTCWRCTWRPRGSRARPGRRSPAATSRADRSSRSRSR